MKSRIKEFVNKECGFWTLFSIGIALIILAVLLPEPVFENNLPLWLKVIAFLCSFVYQYFFAKLYWHKKENGNIQLLIIIMFWFQYGLAFTACLADFVPVWYRICALSNVFIGFVILIIKAMRLGKTIIEDEEIKKQSLSDEYSKYIDIVDKKIEEISNSLIEDEELREKVYISKENGYIDEFSEYIEWITDKRIIGKPDSFIIASCLVYSLMYNPKIICDDVPKIILLPYNLQIALDCAFEIISEPITYYQNDSEEWIEEKHPKVKISVPDGIIKKSPLEQRVCNALIRDEYPEEISFIIQFSNFLHLIYLYCQKK